MTCNLYVREPGRYHGSERSSTSEQYTPWRYMGQFNSREQALGAAYAMGYTTHGYDCFAVVLESGGIGVNQ